MKADWVHYKHGPVPTMFNTLLRHKLPAEFHLGLRSKLDRMKGASLCETRGKLCVSFD